jgi:hypothetical protein
MTFGYCPASEKCKQVWRKVREMVAWNQFVDTVSVQYNYCGSTSSGIAGVGRVVRLPRAIESKWTEKMGSKINSVDLKKKVNFWPKK